MAGMWDYRPILPGGAPVDSEMTRLTVPAYGKINLALYVLGKRPDGYHDIATLIQAIDTCDRLEIDSEVTDFQFSCSDPDLPSGDSNLVVKAVLLLERECGRKLLLRVHLEKELPVGAGMGGGSSDAASTLWGVNKLCGLGLSDQKLRELGAELGSDVPFFLSSGQAIAEGRGERLTEVDWPLEYHILLAFPGVPISASEGYRRAKISLTNPLSDCKIQRRLAPERFWGWVGSQENDLTAGITASYPVVARGIEAMQSLGSRFAGMTGSGSAVFGLFDRPLSPNDWQLWPVAGEWRIWTARPLRNSRNLLPAIGWDSPGG